MPSVKQTTVEAAVTERDFGSSDTNSLKLSYRASPIYAGELTVAEREQAFRNLVQDGKVVGGFGIPEYNREFNENGAPNLDDVKTGAGGLPASPYVPNPASPGPGSQNPSDLPAPPEGFGAKDTATDTYGVGEGSVTSPQATSKKISAVTIGSYLSGKSGAGS